MLFVHVMVSFVRSVGLMPPSWEYKRICNISTRLLLSSSSSYCWLLGKKQTKNQGIMQLEKKEIAKSTNQQTYGKPKTSSLDGWLNEWLHKLPGSKQSGPWVEHIRPPFVTARRSMSAKKSVMANVGCQGFYCTLSC